MTKTLTFEYKGETIVLEDKTEDCMLMCFANPSWRVLIKNRSDEDFIFRLTLGNISEDGKTAGNIIFDYGCVCIIPPKRSIYTWTVMDMQKGEKVDKETVATVFRPIFREVTKQLKQELREPFLDDEYMEKFFKELDRQLMEAKNGEK